MCDIVGDTAKKGTGRRATELSVAKWRLSVDFRLLALCPLCRNGFGLNKQIDYTNVKFTNKTGQPSPNGL